MSPTENPSKLSELQIQRACDVALRGSPAADILGGNGRAQTGALGWLTYWAVAAGQSTPTATDATRFLEVLRERF